MQSQQGAASASNSSLVNSASVSTGANINNSSNQDKPMAAIKQSPSASINPDENVTTVDSEKMISADERATPISADSIKKEPN